MTETQRFAVVQANIEKEVSMTVYSSKSGAVRQLFITPSTLWGGQGPPISVTCTNWLPPALPAVRQL